MNTVQSALCYCGAHHPAGVLCDKVKNVISTESCCGSKHTSVQVHGESERAPQEDDETHEHAHGTGNAYSESCNHVHAAFETVNLATLGTTSATRAIYRIANMDCPMEEALIRKKLGGMQGIVGLEFNLMQRVLAIDHSLSSTDVIEAALRAIDMIPEPLGAREGVMAVFTVTAMDCPAEEGLIKSKLAGMSGVLGLEFNLMRRTLKVRHVPEALPAITEMLAALDLGAQLLDAGAVENTETEASRIPWARLIAAFVLAVFSEVFELLHEWQVSPFGFDWNASGIGGLVPAVWLPMALALAAILLGGLQTFKKGWIAIKNFNLNINALMSVAVTGAVIIGQFPEAAMVMALFGIAEAIEAKALDHARNAVKDLLNLTPEKATVQLADGSWTELDVRQVAVGSCVRVRPGERVALDGVILHGRSTINQAPITGESLPVEKGAGDVVFAGTINEAGSFEFEVTFGATDSTLARIIHAVEEAQGSRAPTQRFVDRFARIYTPAVFALAILVALIPPLFMNGTWLNWIYTALVLLVIGCPCALVISTPVSIVSGMAAAARHGILIKGGVYLEQGRKLKWLALDKTGTITHGKPKQTDFINLGTLDDGRIRALAAGLAGCSDHPVSRAIAAQAAAGSVAFVDVYDFAAIAGQGVSGMIDGQKWYLGNHRMVEELKKCSTKLEELLFRLENQGKTVVALIGDEGAQGIFAVADTLKETSVAAVKELKALGVKTMMLTGDNEQTARVIAEQVGVEGFEGNLLPEDKLKAVELLAGQGSVGMVGDGINDAPALARADIGFAMAAAGTDTAIETADVALMDDDLRKIPRFIRLSRSTHAILVQNITLTLVVKGVFFALTFMGLASMWMAVFADMGASLLVVANGLRAMSK